MLRSRRHSGACRRGRTAEATRRQRLRRHKRLLRLRHVELSERIENRHLLRRRWRRRHTSVARHHRRRGPGRVLRGHWRRHAQQTAIGRHEG
jgi:hypothetical protein